MRRTLSLFLRSKFATSERAKKVLEEYNNTITQLRKIQDSELKEYKLKKATQEMSSKINEIKKEEELERIKNYLMEGLEKKKENSNINSRESKIQVEQEKSHIPANLEVRKLKFLDKKILLLGVDEQNEDHCIYLKKAAQRMNTKIVFTALPPDMPYFIKTQLSFAEEWQKFIKDPAHAKQSKFYLNPSPFHIDDMCLKHSQKQLVRSSLNKSTQFNQIFYTILKYSKRENKFLPNALLTPLLINNVQKVYFCDYPVLKQRQLWALTIPVTQLRQLFEIYHREYHKEKEMLFDPRILFPKTIISRKFKHMANVIKYASHQAKQPSIFVCPAEYTEMFCRQWKKDQQISPYSDFSFSLNINKQTKFIDFVEKLVIMDIILEPIIQKYFIKHLSFPYTAIQTLGGKENIGKIFIVWRHFYNIYRQALQKQPNN